MKKKSSWDFLKVQQTKKQKAGKVAEWIVGSILKLDDENLLEFYNLIKDELLKRGVLIDRSS